MVGGRAGDQDQKRDVVGAWGVVRGTRWTHKVGGLPESDFVFAAEADQGVSA